MPHIIMLTDEERIKFARYCESESISAAEMAEQCKKIGSTLPVARMYNAEAMAFKIIADKLNNTESVSIKKGDT